jgi:hypothetical protein
MNSIIRITAWSSGLNKWDFYYFKTFITLAFYEINRQAALNIKHELLSSILYTSISCDMNQSNRSCKLSFSYQFVILCRSFFFKEQLYTAYYQKYAVLHYLYYIVPCFFFNFPLYFQNSYYPTVH